MDIILRQYTTHDKYPGICVKTEAKVYTKKDTLTHKWGEEVGWVAGLFILQTA